MQMSSSTKQDPNTHLALIAQRSLKNHLLFHQHVVSNALAEITPGLVSQCAPIPTYRVLAAFDDIATHVVLDSLFLGFRTRKMNLTPSFTVSSAYMLPTTSPTHMAGNSFNTHSMLVASPDSMFDVPTRMVHEPADFMVDVELVADVLCRYVSDQLTLMAATHAVISSIPWLRLWIEQELPLPYIRHFCRHLQRYIAMHSPMAGYDICETTRFNSCTAPNTPNTLTNGIAQATLVATRAWCPGEELLLCGGRIIPLSSQDENVLQEQGRDFSVLLSRRSGDQNLFLGPGRFVNHDCQPNLSFVVRNTGEVHFRVIKPIAIGQELSVSYGDDYFGLNNIECMCETCELTHRGWFASKGNLMQSKGAFSNDGQEPKEIASFDSSVQSSSEETNNLEHECGCSPEKITNGKNQRGLPITADHSNTHPMTTPAPYLDWFDGPIAEGSDDVDRNAMTAALSALSDFQRRQYLAISGYNAQVLGDPLTVPCALCLCRTYVYRVAPQGHVHCHKCLRNVMLFSVPWPNRVTPSDIDPMTVLPVQSYSMPVHQQYAFTDKSASSTSARRLFSPSDGAKFDYSGTAPVRNTDSSIDLHLTPSEYPNKYLLADVEQRLLKGNGNGRSLSSSSIASCALVPTQFAEYCKMAEDQSNQNLSMHESNLFQSLDLPPNSFPSTVHSSSGIQTGRCEMSLLNWDYTRSESNASSSPLSPQINDLTSSGDFTNSKATSQQLCEWRDVQAKLNEYRHISPMLLHVKWQFNDEGPLLVKNYNQRNLVLCADKGTWYPAVTVPVSDWEKQKLETLSRDSFHVLFLNISTRSYGCVHRLDMVMVTDILRGGRSLIFPSNVQANDNINTTSPTIQANGTGKVPMVMRAGRDVEIVLKSVQSAAVERILCPPPRAVWAKWHAEYKMLSTQAPGSPFQYHPFANIDIRALASCTMRPPAVTRSGHKSKPMQNTRASSSVASNTNSETSGSYHNGSESSADSSQSCSPTASGQPTGTCNSSISPNIMTPNVILDFSVSKLNLPIQSESRNNLQSQSIAPYDNIDLSDKSPLIDDITVAKVQLAPDSTTPEKTNNLDTPCPNLDSDLCQSTCPSPKERTVLTCPKQPHSNSNRIRETESPTIACFNSAPDWIPLQITNTDSNKIDSITPPSILDTTSCQLLDKASPITDLDIWSLGRLRCVNDFSCEEEETIAYSAYILWMERNQQVGSMQCIRSMPPGSEPTCPFDSVSSDNLVSDSLLSPITSLLQPYTHSLSAILNPINSRQKGGDSDKRPRKKTKMDSIPFL